MLSIPSTLPHLTTLRSRQVLDNAFEGYNTCLFTYGQTGSGKTYSMMGPSVGDTGKEVVSPMLQSSPLPHTGSVSFLSDGPIDNASRVLLTPPTRPEAAPAAAEDGSDDGIVPRLGAELFSRAEQLRRSSGDLSVSVEVSFFQIYLDKVYCLLTPVRPGQQPESLRVREHPLVGPHVAELERLAVDSAATLAAIIGAGNRQRVAAATNMNQSSSRSHAVCSLQLMQRGSVGGRAKSSRIMLVDLAGSERARKSGSDGERLHEAVHINQSLVVLGQVISTLADMCSGRKKADVHVPYRDSVLTWLLKDSLGGNSRTLMLATVSPVDADSDETLQTLRYASQAKKIQCRAVVNEFFPEVQQDEIISALRREVADLRERLKVEVEGRLLPDDARLVHEEELLRRLQRRRSQSEDDRLEHTQAVLRMNESPDGRGSDGISELQRQLCAAREETQAALERERAAARECSELRRIASERQQSAAVRRDAAPAASHGHWASFAVTVGSDGTQQNSTPQSSSLTVADASDDTGASRPRPGVLKKKSIIAPPLSPATPPRSRTDPPTGDGVLRMFSLPNSPTAGAPGSRRRGEAEADVGLIEAKLRRQLAIAAAAQEAERERNDRGRRAERTAETRGRVDALLAKAGHLRAEQGRLVDETGVRMRRVAEAVRVAEATRSASPLPPSILAPSPADRSAPSPALSGSPIPRGLRVHTPALTPPGRASPATGLTSAGRSLGSPVPRPASPSQPGRAAWAPDESTRAPPSPQPPSQPGRAAVRAWSPDASRVVPTPPERRGASPQPSQPGRAAGYESRAVASTPELRGASRQPLGQSGGAAVRAWTPDESARAATSTPDRRSASPQPRRTNASPVQPPPPFAASRSRERTLPPSEAARRGTWPQKPRLAAIDCAVAGDIRSALRGWDRPSATPADSV
eukprot:TRINITY_DN2978_c0_g1_i2.p1 TRINITY_DN2978_c0_g1~~TRINITY_DN2978_c0_g1_i2.p1  ORF type:complete len:924 (+),score=332.63 TRINITY_DN2978_c0_g1_i2:332-3103(+)